MVIADVGVRRKHWSRQEARALTGLFPEATSWELIEGELLDKVGKKRLHIFFQQMIFAWLLESFGKENVLQEPSLDLGGVDAEWSEPEPDIILTSTSIREHTDIPTAADVRLLIEIADTTLEFDLYRKGPLYARANIPEYWVVDVQKAEVTVHRQPLDGVYREIEKLGIDQELSPLGSSARLRLKDL